MSQIWGELINLYDRYHGIEVCPIAHTQIIANIGVMLDECSDILIAVKIKQSIYAPCTIRSECRTSNVAPHLVHDNASYITNAVDSKRHTAYMNQLENYVKETNDDFSKIVFGYLQRESICEDLKYLVDLRDANNKGLVIVFFVKGLRDDTIDRNWEKYYLSKLPKNGICPITGELDHIPGIYPKNIRTISDRAAIFSANNPDYDIFDRVKIQPGYIASQKVIHTLQAFFCDWVEQGPILLGDAIFWPKI